MQKYLVLIIPFLFACTTAPEGCGSGYTNINGDKDHPLGENYRLYIMEDFSHIRADLKYSF